MTFFIEKSAYGRTFRQLSVRMLMYEIVWLAFIHIKKFWDSFLVNPVVIIIDYISCPWSVYGKIKRVDYFRLKKDYNILLPQFRKNPI